MSNTHTATDRQPRRGPVTPTLTEMASTAIVEPLPGDVRTVDRTVDGEPITFAYAPILSTIGTYARQEHVDPQGDVTDVTYAPTGGRPMGWSEQAPERNPLPQRETKVRRSRNGRSTFDTQGPFPWHSTTTGDVHYVDPIADMVATLTATDERSLIAAAEAFVIRATRGAETLPKLIGATTTRPAIVNGDRSTLDATTTDDDDYVPPFSGPVAPRRFVEVIRTATVRRGNRKRRTTVLTVRDMASDEPTPRPARLCAVRHDELATFYGLPAGTYLDRNVLAHRANDTSVSDRHPTRTQIPRGNRLPTCVHRHAKACTRETRSALRANGERCTCRPIGCTCGLDAHGLAILGTWTDDRGRVREVLGRRTATATELVTFADNGYFVGHRFVPTVKATATATDRTPTARERTLSDALAAVRTMTVGTPEHPTAATWTINGRTYNTPATAALALR